MRRGMGTNEKMHPVRLGNNNVIILCHVFVKKNCVHRVEEVAANSDFFKKRYTFFRFEENAAFTFLGAQLDAAEQFPVSSFEYFLWTEVGVES